MPEITRFYGILIKMYFAGSEHNPPHVHAIYGEYMGEFEIRTGRMMRGDLPGKAALLVQEWMSKYAVQLSDMWETQQIGKLPPLE